MSLSQLQTQLTDLQKQRSTFIIAATPAGGNKITTADRDLALRENQRQIDSVQSQITALERSQQSQPKTQQVIAPLPPENTADIKTITQTTVNPTTGNKTTEVISVASDTALSNRPKTLDSAKNSPVKLIPTNLGPVPVATFEAGANDKLMQEVGIPALEIAGIAGLTVISGGLAPAVLAGAAAAPALDVGIKSVSKSLETGTAQLVLPGSVREVTDSAVLGAGLSLAGGGAVSAIGKAAPVLAGQAANPILKGATRVAVNAGLGGGVSGVVSGGDPQAILEGAAFGAGLGIVGEVAGPAASKAGGLIRQTSTGKAAMKTISNIKENVVGTKFTEITGANELAVQTTQGKTTTIKQITEPTTKTVTLRGKDAAFYKETNLSTLRNPKIEFAGTEKVYAPDSITGGKTVEPIPTLRQIESTRTATPVFEALKGNTDYKLGIVKTGKAGNFLETISDLPALQRTKVGIRIDKGQPNAIVSEKTIVTTKESILPDTKISIRDYSTAKVRGTVDPKIYADPAKALPSNISQDIYKKLGGNYRPIADFGKTTKNTAGAMKAGSNDFFKNVSASKGKGSGGSAKTPEIKLVEKTTTVNKEVTLPRAIVGEVKTSSMSRGSAWATVGASNIWNRQRQTQPELIEESYVTSPKNSPLPTPKTITEVSITPKEVPRTGNGLTPIIVTPIQEVPKVTPQPKNVYPVTPPSRIPIIPVTPQKPVSEIPKVVSVPDVISDTRISIINIPDIRTSTRETPITTPVLIDVPKVKSTPITVPKNTTVNKKLMPPIIPFTRGSSGSSGGFKGFRRAAGLRKQAIPTPKELVKQSLGKNQVFKAKSLAATGNKFFVKPKAKSRRKR